MTHLYLIRHGENVDGLEDGKYCDLGLSPEGIHQSELLRDRLIRTGEIKPNVFISSPERRAHETAKILAPAFALPIVLDKDVEEWRSDDGSLSPDEFMERWRNIPKGQEAYYRWIEGYENRLEFSLRVNLALNRILQEHVGKTIVLLGHGAFIQISFGFFFGHGEVSLERAMPEIARTSVTHWYKPKDGNRWILERSNDCYHLL
ncbi:MAG: histidine phosphatase family protein [Anaerolineales bacterium]